jgi:hypothetical protein
MRAVGRRLVVAALVGVLAGGLVVAARPARRPTPGTTTAVSPVPATLPLRAVIVSRTTAGSVLTLTIACKHGSASDVCSGPITMSATGGKKVGDGSYSVTTGMQTTVALPLDAAGLSLLSKSYKLTAMLSLAGTTAVTKTVHFRYRRIMAPISFTWAFNSSYTVAQELRVSGVPAGGTVEVICDGGGCPFGSNSFSPGGGGNVNLQASLGGVHLHPHATLELEVTDTNEVGKVVIFTIQSGQQPNVVEKCLLPGATSPSHCA